MTQERERTLFRLTFAALCLFTLIPFWTVRYHPIPDLPNHIAAASVWHNYGKPDFDFQRYYALRLGPTPYWGYYLLAHLFAFPFGLDIANRLILSLYAVGLPIGMLLLARRFQRSDWLVLFVFPLIWNFNLAIGFGPYVLGLALLPFALVAFDRFCAAPNAKTGAWAAALGTATFFCHLLPWGMWLAMAGMIGLFHADHSWKTIAKRFAIWLIPVAVGVLVMRLGSGYEMGRVAQGIAWRRYPLDSSLKEMPLYLLDNYTTSDDDYVAIALALLFIIVKVTQKWQRITLHDLRAESCFLVCIVAYFVLPRSILRPNYWWGVNVRFAAPAMIFAALCVSGAIAGWRRWLMAGVAVCGVALALINEHHWHKADVYFGARQFDALAQLPPPRARTLVLTFPPLKEPEFRQNYVQSYPALFQAFHGGFYPANFDEAFPLVYKQRFPSPGWRNAEDFRWDYHARYYDYVLAYRAPTFGVGHAELIKRDDPWTLWKLPGPRDDVPPAPPYPGQWATDPSWRPPKH
jgi:hypothetical protein